LVCHILPIFSILIVNHLCLLAWITGYTVRACWRSISRLTRPVRHCYWCDVWLLISWYVDFDNLLTFCDVLIYVHWLNVKLVPDILSFTCLPCSVPCQYSMPYDLLSSSYDLIETMVLLSVR
jgi:hypothetical protein